MHKPLPLLVLALLTGITTLGSAQAPPRPPTTLDECLMKDRPAGLDRCTKTYAQANCDSHQKPPAFDLLGCIAELGQRTAQQRLRSTQTCQERERAHTKAVRAEQTARHRRCTAQIQAQVQIRNTALETCSATGKYSACLGLSAKGLRDWCVSRCVRKRDATAKAAAQAAQDHCEARFVQSQGRGRFACTIAHADGSPAPADNSAAERNIEAMFKSGDPALMDKAAQRSDTLFANQLQAQCTQQCNERGPELLDVARKGPGLVRAYKRCMVAADSTRKARKLQAYETSLYCEHLARANARCRRKHRCDWVEEYSTLQCAYDSPGVSQCL